MNPLLILLGSILFFSCDKEEEPIPAYIHIPAATLITDYSMHGSDDHDITDLWVYVNDQLIGLYDLPATIPIIAEGPTSLSFEAGVLENGFVSVRKRYPFYTFSLMEVDLNPTEIDTIIPVFEYEDNAVFVVNTDFELGNNFEVKEGGASFQTISGGQAYEGARSGYIQLQGAGSNFIAGAIESFFLPQPGGDAKQSYLELNYKNDETFNIFLTGTDLQAGQALPFVEFLLTIPPSEDWNKIYVSLTNAVAAHEFALSYNLGFEATLGSGVSVGNFYYDNIKIIHKAF